ncbi:GlsB/YeaQ/YmgE family stress response membrane protein [Roseomonas stagni]|uniref:GlsB/YeaQ/YmgE family stress response membrane protein n=1 Tax=Falsiroseomonas algicola TaxID=2716930 RepID=A0A6M1LS21_9PROT|nr:GlsB/YeaQ/YmgE family stress response membrane protein [Falsiroseomonas algicola]NGM23215.1 GlsB/YeaQ/YmgE family stress response membrane protein [Falsiroseomonas algicola]
MGFIWTIIIGLIAGAIAKFIMPGRDPGGIIVTILLGIVGALVATWLGQAIGWYRAGEGAGLIGAVVGAIIILVVYRMVVRRDPAIRG